MIIGEKNSQREGATVGLVWTSYITTVRHLPEMPATLTYEIIQFRISALPQWDPNLFLNQAFRRHSEVQVGTAYVWYIESSCTVFVYP